MQQAIAPVSVFRLRFIDMARAVAILLMLEGHFVEATLADEWRVAGHPVYETWLHIRGLAAPMFFMVTGVIFSYLLSGAAEPSFFRIKRVRRGLLRAAELMFWGYFLQTDLRRLPDMLREGPDRWFGAFHVLQCIACGLLVMIALHGLARRAGRHVVAAAHVLAGFALFLASVVLVNHSGFLPAGAPEWLQNPIKGPMSPFPLAPWLGYTLYGAAVGVMLRKPAAAPSTSASSVWFFAIGLALSIAGWYLDRAIGGALLDLTGHRGPDVILPDAFHGRVGEILLLIGLLVWIENRFHPHLGWLQTIGRNTFPIYVTHVIVLYGGIIGTGIEELLPRTLKPWQAGAGAVVFCACFALAAQLIEPLALRWRMWRQAGHARPGR